MTRPAIIGDADVAARDHSNSEDIGLKKMPKVEKEPTINIEAIIPAVATM